MSENESQKGKLARYEVIEVQGKNYVRKDRYDELERAFDAVCQAHTEFVNKLHDALSRR